MHKNSKKFLAPLTKVRGIPEVPYTIILTQKTLKGFEHAQKPQKVLAPLTKVLEARKPLKHENTKESELIRIKFFPRKH